MSEQCVTAENFLEYARAYFKAFEQLSVHASSATLAPMGLLASHAVELALKAYLLRRGSTKAEVRKIGHKLTSAWDAANQRGLGLSTDSDLMLSVRVLCMSHSDPLFRYPREGAGIITPEIEVLARHVRKIVDTVAATVEAPDNS